ncbi:ATP-dependent nuclease [Microbacterium sp.]|uniref:ATP-dependent nuclease n=1 Tax=Microbacterium sp. TaxID=51671 RepID=UPI003C792F48
MSDGTQIGVPEAGVVIFVGPNNAGKSQSLKDIRGLLRDGSYNARAIKRVSIGKDGSGDDAREWATRNLRWRDRDGVTRAQVAGWGEVGVEDVAGQWTGVKDRLDILTDTFVLHADGTSRLTAGNAPSNVDFRTQFPTHPIQRASREPRLEREFNEIGESAFGLGVTVDRYAGSVIPLRLGPRPVFAHTEGVPTDAYLEELDALPQLEEQGDGVKSFLGLTIQLVAGTHQILLIDEPEAFLHPPQARLLGRLLAERAADHQVFIATHSSDIVRGALESSAAVTIIRLRRSGHVNEAAVLDDAAIKALWADPLLRYSEVLDGLFHDAVVVCEADSDCRYFAAVRDHLFPDGGGKGRRPELLFTHCGGKARLPIVIRALRAVNVPVLVVADFDVLREPTNVRAICDAMGGDWSAFATRHGVLTAALNQGARVPSRTAVREAIIDRLGEANEALNSKDFEDLRRILRVESGWDRVKAAGLSGVPQGDPAKAASEILAELADLGVLVVPVGELERFEPSIPGHGPGWVNEVLSRGKHKTPSQDASDFVTQLENIARRQSGLALSLDLPSGG